MLRLLSSVTVTSILLAACASTTPPSKMDPRTKNPCVTCEPESFCAGWSLPEDRRCTKDDDCILAKAKFESVDCSFGLYGGAASAVSSRDAEARVVARLKQVNPCELRDRLHYGSVCAAPPLVCAEGLCGFKNAPPQIAF